MKGKSIPIVKKLIQLIVPPIMKAAGREDCINNSAVRVFVMPPGGMSFRNRIGIMLNVHLQYFQCQKN